MAIWHKRAIISTVVWVIATTGFLVISMSGDGPVGLEDDSPQRNAAGAFIGGGLFLHMVVRYLTRERKDAPARVVDERDQAIARRSSEIALGLTAAGVFLGCIRLHDVFQDVGVVSVSWVWFLGYCSFILSHLGQSVLALAMYSGIGGHAQG